MFECALKWAKEKLWKHIQRHQVGSTTHTRPQPQTHTYTHLHTQTHASVCCIRCVYQPRSVLLRVDSFRNIVANTMKSNEATTKPAKSFAWKNEEEEVEINDDWEILRVGSIEFVQRENWNGSVCRSDGWLAPLHAMYTILAANRGSFRRCILRASIWHCDLITLYDSISCMHWQFCEM